jgi:two-component system nitrogen regulation sensor histidine kinase NtrY
VARRIAHEIKYPLTPIQLSAERLKRKYLKLIDTDKQTFVDCTDTIIRQVGDIGRMVDEFSAFARMPTPVIKPENLNELAMQAVFLARTGYPKVKFVTDLPAEPVSLRCDGRQIGQALTNLLKNAVEATQAVEEEVDAPKRQGEITVRLKRLKTSNGGDWAIVVEDNGKGLPNAQRDRLTEPYMTTRAKGTGLGLAIVKKIMEDHGGEVTLEDRIGGGARVSLRFKAMDSEHGTDVAVS